MAKRLLSKDYERIVLETLNMPVDDFYNYYSNLVDGHYSDNKDIFQKLISAINKIKLNPDTKKTLMIQRIGKKGDINKSFFDKQIEQIKKYEGTHEIDRMIFESRNPKFRIHEFEKESTPFSKLTYIETKNFPNLPDCFIDKKYFFDTLLKFPQVMDLYTMSKDDSYYLKRSKKCYLSGLAHRLLDTGKLRDIIVTNQDLAKVFCPFFHVKFNPIEDKQFQPERAKTQDFLFIK